MSIESAGRSLARYCLTAVLLLMLHACSSVPATHYYVLGSTPPIAADAPGDDGIVLGVSVLTADPPYDQDQLVYRIGKDASEIGLYAHHRWAAPPGRLLQTALCKSLIGLPGIARVEPVTVTGSYAVRLVGRIVLLEEVDVPGTQIARLRLALKLLAADGEALWSGEVAAEVPGQADEVADVVAQMQQAFDQVVVQVRGELGDALGKLEPVQ